MMECMANSDNVIRAGLTPKLRDVPNLIANLTFNAAVPESHIVKAVDCSGALMAGRTMLYDPPVQEFSVLRLECRGEYRHEGIPGPSICIVTEGSGTITWGWKDDHLKEDKHTAAQSSDSDKQLSIQKGDVFFVGMGCWLSGTNSSSESLVIYRAFVTADTER
jgi:mannose-6-phosphate isomerase